jgi:hypothetical protein
MGEVGRVWTVLGADVKGPATTGVPFDECIERDAGQLRRERSADSPE